MNSGYSFYGQPMFNVPNKPNNINNQKSFSDDFVIIDNVKDINNAPPVNLQNINQNPNLNQQTKNIMFQNVNMIPPQGNINNNNFYGSQNTLYSNPQLQPNYLNPKPPEVNFYSSQIINSSGQANPFYDPSVHQMINQNQSQSQNINRAFNSQIIPTAQTKKDKEKKSYSIIKLKTNFSDDITTAQSSLTENDLLKSKIDNLTNEYFSIFNKVNSNLLATSFFGKINFNQINSIQDNLKKFENLHIQGYRETIGEASNYQKIKGDNKNYGLQMDYNNFEEQKRNIKEFIRDYKYDIILKKYNGDFNEMQKMKDYVKNKNPNQNSSKNNYNNSIVSNNSNLYKNNSNNYMNQNLNLNPNYNNYSQNYNTTFIPNYNNPNLNINNNFNYSYNNQNMTSLNNNSIYNNNNTNNSNSSKNNYNNSQEKKISMFDFDGLEDDAPPIGPSGSQVKRIINIQLKFHKNPGLDEILSLEENLKAEEIYRRVCLKKRDAKLYSVDGELLNLNYLKSNTVKDLMNKIGSTINIY